MGAIRLANRGIYDPSSFPFPSEPTYIFNMKLVQNVTQFALHAGQWVFIQRLLLFRPEAPFKWIELAFSPAKAVMQAWLGPSPIDSLSFCMVKYLIFHQNCERNKGAEIESMPRPSDGCLGSPVCVVSRPASFRPSSPTWWHMRWPCLNNFFLNFASVAFNLCIVH